MSEAWRKLKRLDWTILFILVCFMFISTTAIYSSTSGTTYFGLHRSNLVMYLLFFPVMIGIALFDYRVVIQQFSPLLYMVGVLSLVLVLLIGDTINGSTRWLDLGFIQFQPSELAKVFVILFLARLLAARKGEPLRILDLLILGSATFIPFFLVLKQPDLGTSLVFLCICMGMLWVGHIRVRQFMIGVIGVLILAGKLIFLYFTNFDLFSKIIKDHQLKRIQTFLDPSSAADGGWHVVNSMTAIGSGQLLGSGFQNGHYIQNGYIPYSYSDSIFVVVGEEFGFLGAVVLIFLYFLLIYRMIMIAMECTDLRGTYLIIGVISMLCLQVFENVGMHIGMMPLTGISLPFISYGGSSLLINMILMGLILSVRMNETKFSFID